MEILAIFALVGIATWIGDHFLGSGGGSGAPPNYGGAPTFSYAFQKGAFYQLQMVVPANSPVQEAYDPPPNGGILGYFTMSGPPVVMGQGIVLANGATADRWMVTGAWIGPAGLYTIALGAPDGIQAVESCTRVL